MTNTIREVCQDFIGIEETDFAWAGEQCGKGFTEQVTSQGSITVSQVDLKGEKSIPE